MLFPYDRYCNPFLQYGVERLCAATADAGADGFIIVDLPPEEAGPIITACDEQGLSYVPLVAPTSTDERIDALASSASSFLYCVSMTGVTGTREVGAGEDLSKFIARVRARTDLPIAVGFGITTPEQVADIAVLGDGVVVGSALLNAVDAAGADADTATKAEALRAFSASLKGGAARNADAVGGASSLGKPPTLPTERPPEYGFGEYGGRYIPETLSEAHEELEAAWAEALADPEYVAELAHYRQYFIGGPTPLYLAKVRLSRQTLLAGSPGFCRQSKNARQSSG